MKTRIPDSVLAKTTKCPNDFSCLETGRCGDPSLCEVDYADGINILFLIPREWVNCPYRITFAARQVCRCPTNFVIHQERRD